MSLFPNDVRMKPIIILPPELMEREDIEILRENGICVVVAKDPAAIRFIDPIPSISSRTEIENAAIQLSRKVMSRGYWTAPDIRKEVVTTFVELLVKGSALDPNPTRAEKETEIFDQAKIEELRKLAREEAKAERIAAKVAKGK